MMTEDELKHAIEWLMLRLNLNYDTILDLLKNDWLFVEDSTCKPRWVLHKEDDEH